MVLLEEQEQEQEQEQKQQQELELEQEQQQEQEQEQEQKQKQQQELEQEQELKQQQELKQWQELKQILRFAQDDNAVVPAFVVPTHSARARNGWGTRFRGGGGQKQIPAGMTDRKAKTKAPDGVKGLAFLYAGG